MAGLVHPALCLDNRVMQPTAYRNKEFLDSEEARPLRILAEYLEPLRRFRAENIQDTVVFFGSARIHSRERAEQALQRILHRLAGKEPSEPDEHLLRGRKAVEWSRYYEEARELARRLTEWSLGLGSPRHRFVVASGGGAGIMEAANRGANEAGGKTVGLNIRLPLEQGANAYISEELHFEFHYFFMRKFWFAYLAKALVVFPGGFGTLDEMFEILTLMQTEKLAKQIQIILYGTDYWNRILDLEPMVEWGAISPGDLHLLQRADTPVQAFELLKAHLTAHHLEPPTPQEAKAPGIAKTRS
ncbi:MAG: TIGR00730 family Rossman fold protein [Acidobacteria bacterium]|nr:TIGR00730 family Rossman fold protein [Acidobacteriota bacterium]